MSIPSRAEVLLALDGVWRLACRDPAGMARFDGSLDQFWKSFFSAVLTLPFFALLLAMRDLPLEPRGGTGIMLVVVFSVWLDWLPVGGMASIQSGYTGLACL